MIMDLKLINGQEAAKRAIEIAVTGGHSLLLCGPSGCGKSTLAECARHLAANSDALSIYDDIDLDYDTRRLRRDLDEGQAIVAAAADMPSNFAIVDRFAIVVILDRLTAADLILPPPAEGSAAVRTRIIAARKRRPPEGPDSKALELLRTCAEQCLLSARAYNAAIAVAATITKLDGTDKIGRLHLAEALSYLGATRAPKAKQAAA
jgi:predicted ATPase with chaperone activity